MSGHLRSALRGVAAALLAAVAVSCAGPAAPPVDTEQILDPKVEIIGTAGLRFDPDTVALQADVETNIVLTSLGVRHNLVLERPPAEVDPRVVSSTAGKTGVGALALPAGTWPFYCDVPGHREAGMIGRFIVE